jgi:hypothetical protein
MGKEDADHGLDVTPEQALRLLVLNPELFLLRADCWNLEESAFLRRDPW